MIIISTEATADCPESIFRDDLKIIPMGYTVNGIGYDGINEKLSPHEFYEAVANAKTKSDLPQTTMVTEYTATEFFENLLKQGHDIIHIGFSSHLSGTFEQETKAVNALKEKYPERKITLIDSFSACFGEGLIAYYALQKKDEGASYEEIVEYTKSIIQNSNAIFVIDDLMHLCRTGRAAKSEAYLGTAFHVKPILYIANDGSLQPFAKEISQKKALKTMLKVFENNAWSPEKTKLIGIGHADDLESANLVIDSIKEMGYKNVIPFDVGPVIGTHVGKGMICIIFMGNEKDQTIKNR